MGKSVLQISNLEKGSSQVFSHSLYERDLEIGRLRKESEKLKRDHALTAGLVTSLQREIAGKEQKIQQLQQDVEKVKKETRAKDNQLAVLSAKVDSITHIGVNMGELRRLTLLPVVAAVLAWIFLRAVVTQESWLLSPSSAESLSLFCIQVACAKILLGSHGNPFMWLPVAQPVFPHSRLFLCVCSSLLSWQNCSICIMSVKQCSEDERCALLY
uniref:Uncharacterized protein n=1 Tax=Melopsittacus undulatus TaxID=13146 RepID=A0A8V5H6W1_MELUD